VNGLSGLDAVGQRHLNVLRRCRHGNAARRRRCWLAGTVLLDQRERVAAAVGFEMDRRLAVLEIGGVRCVRGVIGSPTPRVRAAQRFLGGLLARRGIVLYWKKHNKTIETQKN